MNAQRDKSLGMKGKMSSGDEVALASPLGTELHQYSDYESAPRGILQTQEFVIDSAS